MSFQELFLWPLPSLKIVLEESKCMYSGAEIKD